MNKKKILTSGGERHGGSSGVWDSVHVFEVQLNGRRSANYQVTSTVMLDMTDKSDKLGRLDISGNLTRQLAKTLPMEDEGSHIANIGTLIEEIESKLRNTLNEVYFGKTRDIVGDLRSVASLSEVRTEKELQSEVAKGLGGQ
jgi:capping protein beta